MSVPTAAANVSDELAFLSRPLPRTDPDRLAAIATLFGMKSQPIDRCRVLEIGCATGGNLLPMAERLGNSTFVGIDRSQRQIAVARRAAEAVALTNVDLRHSEMLDVDATLGTFDYIICHGVFSRVVRAVQEKILAICKAHLKPAGVAYVHYDSRPGWHLGRMLRDIVSGQTWADDAPRRRLAEVRKLLEFFSTTITNEASPYGRLLKQQSDRLLEMPDSPLLHTHLAAESRPLYFHEFSARAAEHGLQYLGDAAPATMFASNFGPAIEQELLRIGGDIVSVEQHMDVLRNRADRETLLCHTEAPVDRQVRASSMFTLCLSGDIRPESPSPDVRSAVIEKFVAARGAVWSAYPVVKAALCHLGDQWPLAVSFEALIAAAASRLGSPLGTVDRERVARDLLQCVASDMIELRAAGSHFVTSISPFPRATPLARLQAAAALTVANRRHEALPLDEISRHLLQSLDGRHDRAALVRMLIEAVDRGELSILVNGLPANRGEVARNILEAAVDRALSELASNAMLVA